jgi:hypothetical protein
VGLAKGFGIFKVNTDKVSVYYLDPIYCRYDLLIKLFLFKISALLRDHQQMAASKPIT